MKKLKTFLQTMALPFIKKNIFSCLCLLLATLVTITGSVSYAKYTVGNGGNGTAGAGSFSASATIDGVSALSFTNTAFWGGTIEDDKIAMNALRTVNFSVNNYKVVNGEEKVAEVKMRYNLSFSAPVNFVNRLAIQLFNESDKPMLPQVVIADLMHAVEHGHDFQTATSDDFNSVYHHDLTFSVTRSGNDYTAVFDGSIHDEPVVVVIKLEEFERETHQLLHFRSWDTSGLTSPSEPTVDTEGGKLLSPLQVKFTRLIPFYRITISMSNMVLPANEKVTKKHSIRLAPTDALHDDHLAGYFVEKQGDEYVHVSTIYGAENEGESIEYQMQTIKEVFTDKYYTDERAFTANDPSAYEKKNHFGEHHIVTHENNLMGSAHHYIVGETGYFDNTVTSNYLENGAFTHEDRRYIDGTYVYLKRSGTANNYEWQLINESAVPNNDRTGQYYRLKVQYGEIVTKTELKLTQGLLITEVNSIDEYTVVKATTNAAGTHDDVIFNVKSTDLLKYTIGSNATGVKTVSEILDIEETGLQLEVKNGRNWQSTNLTIHEPNFAIKPIVTTTNYTNANDTVVIEHKTEDYIIRELVRDTERITVEVEQVKTSVLNSNGELEEIIYTQNNPFNIYDENGIQKRFISNCYSKNFPFYVNVVFEQVLN